MEIKNGNHILLESFTTPADMFRPPFILLQEGWEPWQEAPPPLHTALPASATSPHPQVCEW